MGLTFEKLWPLLLLALVPYVWWVCRRTAVDLSPSHLRLSTVVRSAVIVCIVLALSQPSVRHAAQGISALYLLDVSQSVSPSSVQEAMQWIRQAVDSGKAAESRFIAFAANSIVFDSLDDLSKVQVSGKERAGAIDQSKTRLADALNHAVRSFNPDRLKRLVLFSDGNANSGNLDVALEHVRGENIRVFTRPMAARTVKDAWIESVMAPATVTAEEVFPVEVHVYSQFETTAEIEVKAGDKVLGKTTTAIKQGMNRVAFEATIKDEADLAVLEAGARIAGDTLDANNSFRQPAAVLGKPRVLYIEGYAPSARYLKDALALEGFQVDVASAAEMPASPAQLDQYGTVIVSDVERRSLSEAQMAALAGYVRDLGGGFILIGGENTYGSEGFTGSVVEEILPVTFDTDKERQSLSMVVVLDRSGSMAGTKMELAKEATKAPLTLLKEEDRFGVLSFDYNFQWALELQEVKDKEDMRETISRIVATGNTNIFPALREAYEKLQAVPGETKHIILLSDGQTPADDFQGLATEMLKDKITVSTVAVTAASDRILMENIAKWGGGRSYYVDNPANVPQIFTDETQLAAGKSLKEESFVPGVQKTVEAFKGIDLKTAPQLHGYVATKAKDTAEVLLTAQDEQPLLARWQYGLGKTAIFTSDAKDRWASDWLKWKSYTKFWAQFVRETMRRTEDESFDLQVRREGDNAIVSINAIEKDGRFRNALQPKLLVSGPGEEASTVDVPQVGPGIYEITVPVSEDGSYVFRASSDALAGPSRMIAYSYPEEYHFYPTDADRLRRISESTGGKYQATPDDVFDTSGESVSVYTPLWPWLAASALVLFVLDVLLRRLRLFES